MPQVEYVQVPGALLWTIRQGQGLPLVLCHGGPGDWDYLGQVAGLIDDIVTVYRYDQRACGRSSGGPPYDVSTAIADLEALRAHWNHPEWIVAGHSWGAHLALYYALAHPQRVRAIIYIAAAGHIAVDPERWQAEYRARRPQLGIAEQQQLALLDERRRIARGNDYIVLDREYTELAWSADFVDRARARGLIRSLFIEGIGMNHEVNRQLGEDLRRYMADPTLSAQIAVLGVPTILIHGACDPRPTWALQSLADLLPCAHLEVLPGAGHFPWLDQPEGFTSALRRFLQAFAPHDH
jgi:proline iminopeptidase